MVQETKLDMADVREELRVRNARLIAEGHALPYRDGDEVAFTRVARKNSGKAA